MTADGLVGKLTSDGPPPTLAQVLALVDRIVQETGRRRHMFGWLRVPGGGADEWLIVDAYYPSNRLVVVWRSTPGPHDRLYREQIPAHGMRLLELSPGDLGSDMTAIEAAIEHKLAVLGPAPPRHAERAVYDGPTAVSRAMSSFAAPSPPPSPPRRVGASQAAAAERAARFVSTRRSKRGAVPAPPQRPAAAAVPRRAAAPQPRRPPPTRNPTSPTVARRQPKDQQAEAGSVGFWVTLVLAAALIVEVYLGVGGLGIDDGRPLLAFGIALDVCSRALGTLAASRAGQEGWALLCALGGSPFVASFALFQRTGPAEVEPAPLAGLLAVIACAVVALAIAVQALGA